MADVRRMLFTGMDGSLGFRHGQVYALDVGSWRYGGVLVRCLEPGPLYGHDVPYSSVGTFLDNWSPACGHRTTRPEAARRG